MTTKYILVFESYNNAFYFCNVFSEKRIEIRVVETPTNLSSNCTKSVVFSENILNLVYKELRRLDYNIRGLFKILKEEPYFYRIL